MSGVKKKSEWLLKAVVSVLVSAGMVNGGVAIDSVHESHQPGMAVLYWVTFLLLLSGLYYGLRSAAKAPRPRLGGWLLTAGGLLMTAITVAVFVYPSLNGPYYDAGWHALGSAVPLLLVGAFLLLGGHSRLVGGVAESPVPTKDR